MTEDSDDWVATSDPATIWPLPEEVRWKVVADLIRKNSEIFYAEAIRGNTKIAQESAQRAISAIAGLFPDPNDPAHILLLSLAGVFWNARSGNYDHILLKSGSRIDGTKGGFGHVYVRAFAVSAVKLLSGRRMSETKVGRGMSERKARIEVAKILADLGYSRKTDDHSQPKPLTASAVRHWYEDEEKYPMQHAMAKRLEKMHAQKLDNGEIDSAAKVITYLRKIAKDILIEAKLYG